MKRKWKRILWAALALCMLLGGMTASAQTSQAAESTKKETKYGWFQKGKYRYYRKENGKLYKNTTALIGNYIYRFDRQGRMVTGTVKDGKEISYYNKKTGRFEYCTTTVKIEKKEKFGSILVKNCYGKYRSKYRIYSDSGVKIYGKNGKRISFSKLKKGQKIQVYYDGTIMECYPALFSGIRKICVVS
ncbi:MAG: hypothetical protein Q4F41_08590 [Eubacteriales bacterium]|nr:hypothetical protein [Eubacteriales bacterium]